MEVIEPVSCTASTNHMDAISETQALNVFKGTPVFRLGVGNLWLDLTYNYSNTPYIKNMGFGYLWGIPNYASWIINKAQTSRCMVSCETKDGNRVWLYDSGNLISNIFGIQTKEASFMVNKYIKKINVYISCLAIAPQITLYSLRTFGVYDSGIRFRKGNVTYSLARTSGLQPTGLRFIDSSGTERSLSLVSATSSYASPIRVSQTLAIEKL